MRMRAATLAVGACCALITTAGATEPIGGEDFGDGDMGDEVADLDLDASLLDVEDWEQPQTLLTAEELSGVLDAHPPEVLSKKELRFLKPAHPRLPQNPYAQVDYTAYALEWGEFRLGLGSIGVGILPRTQLSTVPIGHALGMYNVALKVNPVRVGPWDLSAQGSAVYLPMGEFQALYVSGGATTSFKIGKWVGVHGGATYRHARASGVPTKLPPLVGMALKPLGPEEILAQVADFLDTPVAAGDAVTVRAAVDIKLNRRDSILIKASGMPWVRGEADIGISEDQLPEAMAGFSGLLSGSGSLSMKDTWSATVSWQFAFKRFDLRLGGGWSAIPYMWAVDANDVAFRFGGKTRVEDRKRRKGWRANRRELRLGGPHYDAEVLASTAPPVHDGDGTEAVTEAPVELDGVEDRTDEDGWAPVDNDGGADAE